MGYSNSGCDQAAYFGHSTHQGQAPTRQYVKYVPVGVAPTHELLLGYAFWLVGFTGAHRFFFGRTLTGILWFFTFGLFGIGWLVDLFLIPSMSRDAAVRFRPGRYDYNVAWLLCIFLGLLGFHRFYQGKFLTGLLYLATGGLLTIGWIYDICTLNEQLDEANLLDNRTFHAQFA